MIRKLTGKVWLLKKKKERKSKFNSKIKTSQFLVFKCEDFVLCLYCDKADAFSF